MQLHKNAFKKKMYLNTTVSKYVLKYKFKITREVFIRLLIAMFFVLSFRESFND